MTQLIVQPIAFPGQSLAMPLSLSIERFDLSPLVVSELFLLTHPRRSGGDDGAEERRGSGDQRNPDYEPSVEA